MANQRPNILVLFTDDQRFDTIAALGNDAIHTPHMDRLVARGTTFRRAYIMGGSNAAVCMPSRAMLMTGRYLYRLQGAGQTIPPDHVMLPQLLRDHGYVTGGIGKWHNSPPAYARAFSTGAEIFFGGMDDHWNVPACDFDPTGQYPAPRPQPLDLGVEIVTEQKVFDHVTRGVHSSELFGDAAVDFLRTHDKAAPFMLYVAFMAPHDPRTMPREFLELYDPDAVDLPPNFMAAHPFDNGEMDVRDEGLAAKPRDPAEIRRHIAEYYAMISHLDAQIGRVLDALEETGQADNTIIVFAGDNGLALGRHGLMGKQSLYDHSVHVPLILAGPGIPAGAQTDDYAYLLDIYPTLCDLLGVDTPASVDGMSLVPVLRGTGSGRDQLVFAYRDVQRAIQDDRFKLIEYCVDGVRTTQLFDLARDPWELENLADDPTHAARVDALRTELRRQWQTVYGDDQAQGQAFWETYDSRG
ncbi:MAG: sulfatase-like hydrolase/transferase [Caldilineaceae bacterium]|nr:sulfatase-like hydrolase/transferase [Caldilineaceae bacterium]